MADVVNVSKALTATGAVQDQNSNNLPGGGYLRAVVINPGATACTVTIYDNTSAAGRIISFVQGAASGYSVQSPDFRIPFKIGLWAVITGTPTSVVVYYE